MPEYDLPEGSIAQVPLARRDSARLLDASDPGGEVVHRTVWELPSLLRAGDVVVVNSSRVIPARLELFKRSGGAAEVLLVEPTARAGEWQALVRPGRRLASGSLLSVAPGGEPVIEVGERLGEGLRLVRILGDQYELMSSHGSLALPPYIRT